MWVTNVSHANIAIKNHHASLGVLNNFKKGDIENTQSAKTFIDK